MKSILSFSLLLTLLAALLCSFAFADILPEPKVGTEFYEEHWEEFSGVHMSFYVESDSGFAQVYTEPNGTVRLTLENGKRIYVYMSYTDPDGVEWFHYDYGYIKSSDCKEVYTSIQFKREHQDSILPYTSDASQYIGTENVVFWTYPNSGEYFYIDEVPLDESFQINSVYTDENGTVWGNVGYYYGIKDFWVSLSDISGTGETPVNSASPFDTPQTSDGAPNFIVLAVIMVAAVVGVTLLLIFGTKKKKK